MLPAIDQMIADVDDVTGEEIKRLAAGLTLPPISLRDFVANAWRYLEPDTPFVPNWHIDAMCDHLTAVTWGIIQNLYINVPPRHMKSITVGVMWPSWVWLFRPASKWLFFGANATFAQRDNVKARKLMSTPWYQEMIGDAWQFSTDQNTKSRYENTAGGHRHSAGITSVGGIGGDFLVGDDLLALDKAYRIRDRETANENWSSAVRMRKNSPAAATVVICQRLHEHDVIGHIDELEAAGGDHYERLVLPAEYEPNRHCTTAIGFSDPRREPNELLWPDRFPREEVTLQKISLGAQKSAAQLQQRPAPPSGNTFKLTWLRFWKHPGQTLPPVRFTMPNGDVIEIEAIELPELEGKAASWDASFGSTTESSSFVAGHIWGWHGANHYLLDWYHERATFTRTLKAVKRMSDTHADAVAVYFEAKANGPAIIDMLQAKVGGILPIMPKGSKIARAEAVAPLVQAGNVFLPHPAINQRTQDIIDELTMFPFGTTDDHVDALTQYLIERIKRNMKKPASSSRTVSKSSLFKRGGA